MPNFFKILLVVLLLAMILLGHAAPVVAQDETSADNYEKNYVFGYILTIMMLALGLAAACRPGRRADKPKMVEKELEHKLKQMSAKAPTET